MAKLVQICLSFFAAVTLTVPAVAAAFPSYRITIVEGMSGTVSDVNYFVRPATIKLAG
jgi:hypothetical protein